ncbi:MAG: DUF4115 domain-containing protein [Propionibacteriales bacterium]|nr:DUF4115 domain-containing protein [Propionibacteriales bacterium]
MSETTMVPVDETVAPAPVVVRRRAWLSAVIGLGAGVLAVFYVWRAVGQGGVSAWLIGGAMLLLATVHLWQWADSRAPLLVADDVGVRLRLGNGWQGLPWHAVADVEVRTRQGLLRDGRVVVHPADPAAVHAETERGRRMLAANTRVYGAPMAIPLGAGTVTSTDDLPAALEALASGGRSGPVGPAKARPEVEATEQEPSGDDAPEGGPPEDADGPAADAEDPVDNAAGPTADADDPAAEPEPSGEKGVLPAPTLPVRRAQRVDVTRPLAKGLEPDDGSEVPRSADDPASGDHPEPSGDIGTQLTQARELLGLTIDDLAKRTRIRPHVIEAVESDDFRPCGGDFYARGHVRTIARTLGLDGEPLLAAYEKHHAADPVSPREVFEAELAAGESGAIRNAGQGGPRWGALIATVLALMLVWGVASYLYDGANAFTNDDEPLRTSGSQGLPAERDRSLLAPEAVVKIRAVGDDSWVLARTQSGDRLFRGFLREGTVRRLTASEPIELRADNAGAVHGTVNGRSRGPLGAPGETVHLTVRPRPVS